MRRAMTAVLILALALPAAAAARVRVLAPPGNSGVSEYLETVPIDSGQRPTGPTPGQGAGPLTAGQRESLDRHGTDGRTLVTVVDATAVTSTRPSSGHSSSTDERAGQSKSPALSGQGAASPVTSILSAATGRGSGVAIWLPVLLLVVLIGVLARAVLVPRRASRQ